MIDESRGTYKGVGLDSSASALQKAFGDGVSAGGFAPLGRLPSEVGVPPSVPSPPGEGRQRPQLRRYANAAFLLAGGRVFAMMLTDSRLRTRRGIAIGSSLADVRSSYAGVTCSRAPGGETLTGGAAAYPMCRIRLGRWWSLWFGGDPIRSFTFLSREPVNHAPIPRVSWSAAERLVRSCKVSYVEQTHRKTVTLRLRTGQEVWTREPGIDDIVHDVVQVAHRCPAISLATE